MAGNGPTWVARLTPVAGRSVEDLLRLSLGLDVWERGADALVVAAPESRLAELERRRLAHVERWGTPAQYRNPSRTRSESRRADPSDGG
jgi:hypothetical protein